MNFLLGLFTALTATPTPAFALEAHALVVERFERVVVVQSLFGHQWESEPTYAGKIKDASTYLVATCDLRRLRLDFYQVQNFRGKTEPRVAAIGTSYFANRSLDACYAVTTAIMTTSPDRPTTLDVTPEGVTIL